jgi:peptidoglycan hydrolase CwlO-like protein
MQRLAASRPTTADSESQHADKMAQLESQKYTLGKTIADLEQDIASHEARLARTKSASKEAESEDARESDSGALDSDMYDSSARLWGEHLHLT